MAEVMCPNPDCGLPMTDHADSARHIVPEFPLCGESPPDLGQPAGMFARCPRPEGHGGDHIWPNKRASAL